MKAILRKMNGLRSPSFWTAQVLFFLACAWFSWKFYPKAFPIVDLPIQMSRVEALSKARELARLHNWAPSPYRQASTFTLDQMTQTYVELNFGAQGFAKLIQDKLYSPYTWEVRHFLENQASEVRVQFTPEGEFYGFEEKILETQPGAALTAEKARQIAENHAVTDWKVNFSSYHLAETAVEKRIGGRVDHSLIYERDGGIGDAKYRMKLTVSGDRLSEIQHSIKIPEAFIRKYAEMRSANAILSTIATIAMVFFYLFGGCLIGLFFLAREGWVLWKMPVLIAGIVSVFQALERVNQLPLAWMEYDTAISIQQFLLRFSSQLVAMFLLDGCLLAVSFMAAESLSRKAFPHHLQFWRVWKNAGSVEVLGRTVGGYLLVSFFFLFVVVLYYFGIHSLHWWTPSETLYHPDSLASYFPWFSSIAMSLHAGLWEESLFRAVPLAGAALLGARFGGRKKWIVAAFILQALIFAAAHANYPAQPSYARVIELILPSFLFGGLFLAFGLLPGVILHFTFDVVMFAIPIFSAKFSEYGIDQILVVVFALVPLWVCLWSVVRARQWSVLSNSELNQSWHPESAKKSGESEDIPSLMLFSEIEPKYQKGILVVLLSLVVALWLALSVTRSAFILRNDATSLNIDRKSAIQLARQAVNQAGFSMHGDWEPLATVQGSPDVEHRFVWQTSGVETYTKLLGSFLRPPYWSVRFVHFDGDLAERAEEYRVALGSNGEILGIRHDLPEQRKGASLDQDQARMEVKRALLTWKGSSAQVQEILSSKTQLPSRVDWSFIFADAMQGLKSGEARLLLELAGQEFAAFKKFIFVPEDWLRTDRARESLVSVVKMVSALFLVGLMVTGIIVSLRSWTQKKFSSLTAMTTFSAFLIFEILQLMNSFPKEMAVFSTSQPRYHQMANTILYGVLTAFAWAVCVALIAGYVHFKARQSKQVTQGGFALRTLFFGFGIGMLVALICFWAESYTFKRGPDWGRVDSVVSFLPAFAGLEIVARYLSMVLLVQLIQVFLNTVTHHWTYRGARNGRLRQGFGLLLVFGFGFALSGLHAETPMTWVIASIGVSILFYGISRLFFTSDLSLVPPVCAGFVVLSQWRQGMLHAYAGSSSDLCIATLMVVGLATAWFKTMRMRSRNTSS